MNKFFIIMVFLFLSLQYQARADVSRAASESGSSTYSITKISGHDLTLDDGSQWVIFNDLDTAAWKPGDKIQISRVMLYPTPTFPVPEVEKVFNYDDQEYTAFRDLTQNQVTTGYFSSGNSKPNNFTFVIVSIDPNNQQVLLSNGSLIQFDGKDYNYKAKFEGLRVGDDVLLLTDNYIFYVVKQAGIYDWNTNKSLLSGTLKNTSQ